MAQSLNNDHTIIFQLPANWTFLDVMDTFFKVHKVLDLAYHPHLKLMMHFIEYFIYNNKAKNIKVSVKMQDVAHKYFN